VEERAVIPLCDAPSIYAVPRVLHEMGLDQLIVERFNLEAGPADLSEWDRVFEAEQNPEQEITIAMVGQVHGTAGCLQVAH